VLTTPTPLGTTVLRLTGSDVADVDADGRGHCWSCGQQLRTDADDTLIGPLDRWEWDYRASALLSEAREAAEPISLLLVDVDAYSKIREEAGNEGACEVLRAVAGAVRSATGEWALLGRHGGRGDDEFLVLTRGGELVDVQALAERIRDAVRGLVPAAILDDRPSRAPRYTVCLGVAHRQEIHGLQLIDLISDANHALRMAKQRGPGQIVHRDLLDSPA
jgi:diguanylate cyclase (GGDEF)-like protein